MRTKSDLAYETLIQVRKELNPACACPAETAAEIRAPLAACEKSPKARGVPPTPECAAALEAAAKKSHCQAPTTNEACQGKLSNFMMNRLDILADSFRAPVMQGKVRPRKMPWDFLDKRLFTDLQNVCGGGTRSLRTDPSSTTMCWADVLSDLADATKWDAAKGKDPCAAVAGIKEPFLWMHNETQKYCCSTPASSPWSIPNKLKKINCVSSVFASIHKQAGDVLTGPPQLAKAAKAAMELQLASGKQGVTMGKEVADEMATHFKIFHDSENLLNPQAQSWNIFPKEDPVTSNEARGGVAGSQVKKAGSAGNGEAKDLQGGNDDRNRDGVQTHNAQDNDKPGSQFQSGLVSTGQGAGFGFGGPKSSGDSEFLKCIRNTLLCAKDFNDATKCQASSFCQDSNLAQKSLTTDVTGVIESLNASNVQTPFGSYPAKYYMEVRKAAVTKLLQTHYSMIGTYRVERYLGDKDAGEFNKFCRDGELGKIVNDYSGPKATHKPSAEEDASLKAKNSPEYKAGMARAATDILRNLYRLRHTWAYHGQKQPKLEKLKEIPNPPGKYYTVDPDCPCFKTPITAGKGSGLYTYDSSEAAKRIDACMDSCCTTSEANFAAVSGTTGKCRLVNPPPSDARLVSQEEWLRRDHLQKKVFEEAKAAIEKDLREFPLLAAGYGRNGGDVNDWESPQLSIPAVEALWRAAYKGHEAEMHNFKFDDPRLGKLKDDPAVMKAIEEAINGEQAFKTESDELDRLKKTASREFGQTVLKMCKGAEDGGISPAELAAMTDLTESVLKKNPEYRFIQECAETRLGDAETRKTLATVGLTLGCLAAGVLTLGAAAPGCSLLFIGMAAHNYVDAAAHWDNVGKCAGVSDSGVCKPADAFKADRELSAAKAEVVMATAFAFIDAGVLAKQAVNVAKIRQAAKTLTEGEIEAFQKEFAAMKGKSTAGEQARLIEEEAKKLEELELAHKARQKGLTEASKKGSVVAEIQEDFAPLSQKSLKAHPDKAAVKAIEDDLKQLDKVVKEAKARGGLDDMIARIIDEELTGCTLSGAALAY